MAFHAYAIIILMQIVGKIIIDPISTHTIRHNHVTLQAGQPTFFDFYGWFYLDFTNPRGFWVVIGFWQNRYILVKVFEVNNSFMATSMLVRDISLVTNIYVAFFDSIAKSEQSSKVSLNWKDDMNRYRDFHSRRFAYIWGECRVFHHYIFLTLWSICLNSVCLHLVLLKIE